VTPEEAAEALRNGAVALVPTETVVGLVAAEADVLNRVKGSDPTKPIALLCASAEVAFSLASEVPPLARTLADLYWPGPLTLVLDRAGGGTVGLRVPSGAIVDLLGAFGRPLYATSANPTGRPAPRSLDEVDPAIVSSADLAVEGAPGSGEASAVVDLSAGKARMLRAAPGLTPEKLQEIVAKA
jgi:L-threonylcarbamoyladenylate synthase